MHSLSMALHDAVDRLSILACPTAAARDDALAARVEHPAKGNVRLV